MLRTLFRPTTRSSVSQPFPSTPTPVCQTVRRPSLKCVTNLAKVSFSTPLRSPKSNGFKGPIRRLQSSGFYLENGKVIRSTVRFFSADACAHFLRNWENLSDRGKVVVYSLCINSNFPLSSKDAFNLYEAGFIDDHGVVYSHVKVNVLKEFSEYGWILLKFRTLNMSDRDLLYKALQYGVDRLEESALLSFQASGFIDSQGEIPELVRIVVKAEFLHYKKIVDHFWKLNERIRLSLLDCCVLQTMKVSNDIAYVCQEVGVIDRCGLLPNFIRDIILYLVGVKVSQQRMGGGGFDIEELRNVLVENPFPSDNWDI